MSGSGPQPFVVPCQTCGKEQPLSEAFSVARAPQLQYDPVLGPGNGLRFRSSKFRWRSPLFMPLDPFGNECPLLACSAQDCLQPLYMLQVGGKPGHLCGNHRIYEPYVRSNLREQLHRCMPADTEDIPDDERADAIYSYLKALEPQVALVAHLADWSSRGMYSEVESVTASSPSFVGDVVAGVAVGPDAKRLKNEMARLKIEMPIPSLDEQQAGRVGDAMRCWSYAGVRSQTDTFRSLVLDQHTNGPRMREARKAAAHCLLNLSGAFWEENFRELDRATQMVLGKFLTKGGLPTLERERIARELLRSNWVVPLEDRLRQLAQSMIWDARLVRVEASLSSGNVAEFAQAIDGWYRGIDEADGEFESASPAVEERFAPLALVATRSEELLRSKITGVKRLRELVAIANSPQADRTSRRNAADEAESIRMKLGDHVGHWPTVTDLVHQARSPWFAQRVKIRNSLTATWIALVSVAVLVVLLLSFNSCLSGPSQ